MKVKKVRGGQKKIIVKDKHFNFKTTFAVKEAVKLKYGKGFVNLFNEWLTVILDDSK